MKRYLLIIAVAMMTGLPAMASTVQTNVRIETADETIYSGDVYLSKGCKVRDTDGKRHEFKKKTAICALKSAATLGGFDVQLQNSSYGLYLTGVDGQTGSGSEYWSFVVNYTAATVGIGEYEVQNGDNIVLSLGGYPNSALEIKVSKEVKTTQPLVVRVKADGEPVAGATVHVGSKSKVTNQDGKATFKFATPAEQLAAYAEASGYTRTANVNVRVIQSQSESQTISDETYANILASAKHFLTEVSASDELADQTGTLEWIAMALVGAGEEVSDALRAAVLEYDPTIDEANAANNISRHILTLVALGEDPRSSNGIDYVARLLETKKNNQFGYKAYVNDDIFAGLALIAAGESVDSVDVQLALTAIEAGINSDGGVSYAVAGDVSDVDTSAYYLQLLSFTGDSEALQPVVRYVVNQQNLDGGWGYSNHDRSNSSTTAVALQGLIASGRDVNAIQRNHRTGANFLARMQKQSGAFNYDNLGSFSLVPLNSAFSVMAFTQTTLPIE